MANDDRGAAALIEIGDLDAVDVQLLHTPNSPACRDQARQ